METNFATHLMAVCHCLCSDFSPVLTAIGLFFQIRDDYANLKSEEVCPFHWSSATATSMPTACSIQLTRASVKTSLRGNFPFQSHMASDKIPHLSS